MDCVLAQRGFGAVITAGARPMGGMGSVSGVGRVVARWWRVAGVLPLWGLTVV